MDWVQTTLNALVGQVINPGAGFPVLSVPVIDPTTAQITSAGSRMQSLTTALQFVATPTGVTFYYDGTNGSVPLTIYRDDGIITPNITGNFAVSGLTASTTYFFYPYFDETTGKVAWAAVSGAVGTPPVAYTTRSAPAAQQQILRGHISLALGLSTNGITTPAAGSSSGSGGGGGGAGGGGGGRQLL